MGERLVIRIHNKKGKLLAASYQQWAADDFAYYEQRLMDAKQKILGGKSFFRTCKQAVQALMEMLSTDPKLVHPGLVTEWCLDNVTPTPSVATRRFLRRNPEFPHGQSRCDGYITLDQDVAQSWSGWAQMLLDR